MADPRFFDVAGPFTAAELAERIGVELAGAVEPGRLLTDVAPLDAAGPTHVTFLDNPRYRQALRATRAGAAIIAPDAVPLAPAGLTRYCRGASQAAAEVSPSRKVRTSQGRVVAHNDPGKPAGKCHRNKPPKRAATRESRAGKGAKVR